MEIRVDESIALRTLEAADAPALFALVDRERAHLRQWLPWLDVNTRVEDSLAFIRDQNARAAIEENVPFSLLHDGELAGVVAYHTIDREQRWCSVGYWIAARLQGRGIVTRAVRALARHAFDVLGMERVELQAATGNGRSRAVAERLGFRAQRTIDQAEWLYDHHVDHVVYVLEREQAR